MAEPLRIVNVERNWVCVYVVEGIKHPIIIQLREGPVILFYLRAGDIHSMVQNAPPLNFEDEMQHTYYGDVQSIGATADDRGKIYVVFEREDTTYILFLNTANRQRLGGIRQLKVNWKNPAVLNHMGVLFLAGVVDDTTIYISRFQNYGTEQLPFATGAVDKEVTTGTDVDIVGLSGYGNYIEMAIETEEGIVIYCSSNFGETWQRKQVIT